jgi:dTDP-4-amino-4,6-dideoxygalactose transaminase
MGFDPEAFPNAERYYQQAFSIPMYTDLTETDQNTVISSLLNALSTQ